jgi:Carboxypeptidase regulatory-like domain
MRAGYPGVLAGSLLLLPLLSFRTLVAQTQPTRRNAVDGIVVDKGKAPVPSAEVELKRQGEQRRVARSGNDGHFSFPAVQTGPVALTVRRMGYTARTINVDVPPAGFADPIEVELEEIPSDIASVIVESSKQHLQQFYERKASNNFAKFFERKDIQRRNPLYLSEMVATVSGASVSSTGAGNRILLRGCQPMVWVDGMRAPGAELDEVARPSDVAGMEVYPSNAGLPPEYQDRNNRMCGAIMVWTQNQ